MSKCSKKLIRTYRCKICQDTHEVELNMELLTGKKRFPFPYVFLHGDLKEYLTILYLDEELQIRASEVQNLSQDYDNLFSKDHTITIVSNLMEEIETLRRQHNCLFPKEQVRLIISNLMEEIDNLRTENEKLLKRLNILSKI